MATVAGAFFQGHVSTDAFSYILKSIPSKNILDDLRLHDVSGLPGTFIVKPTDESDYVILGSGDELAQIKGPGKGYDVVQTGDSINLKATGFDGVLLTGSKSVS